ncbi:MAG: PDZ domain-containing protein, partial [Gemmataceae bacterium]
AVTWERARDGFDSHAGAMNARGAGKVDPPLAEGYDAYDPVRKWGKGGGIFKTTDGGKTWKKLTKGLPSCETGRVGLDYYRKDPNVVFAVIDSAKIGTGKVPGFLGVTPEAAATGVKLAAVSDGGPAAKAGLKAGDVVTAVGGKSVKGADGFTVVMAGTKPGDKVTLEGTRDGKPLKAEVTLGDRPATGGGPGGRRGLDFKVEEAKEGLMVLALFPQGAAALAGVQAGDLVIAVDGKGVKTSAELTDAVRALTKPGKLLVVRGAEKKELTYTPTVAVARPSTRPYGAYYGGQRENVQDAQGPEGVETGGVYRSADGGESWTRVNSLNPRPMYFSQIRVDPSDDQRVYVLGVKFHVSTNGGKQFTTQGLPVHDDLHAMWINPRDGRNLILGSDGGTYISYDRAAKWDYLNHMALGQFYHVCVDDRKPYRVYGGLQDNGSWGGPSMALDGRGPINADWALVAGGDGFVCRVDPADSDVVYYESQDGNIGRRNVRTGERAFLKPQGKDEAYRFNWNTPFLVSGHNAKVFYCAGNKVFRSIKRGEDPKAISPELCKSGAASASALAESPVNPDVLWAGTDDGQLWVTRDGGAKWDNVAQKVGLPKPFYVATIEPSRTVEGRAYVCFDAHRSDNDDPHVYVTEDHGATWKSLRANLPAGSSRCLREDLYNKDVLYLGTEFAVWASIDRGASWTKINSNLPTVAVHELAQHPTAGEMVAATHGRSLWILDVSALRQLTPALTKDGAKLLTPAAATRWRTEPQRGTFSGPGSRDFFGENPAAGAHVYYTLAKPASKVSLEVQDVTGKAIASLPASVTAGLHRASWNLRGVAGPPLGIGALLPARAIGAAGRAAQPAPAGVYRVVLKVDGTEQVQGLRVENDPTLPVGVTAAEPEVRAEEERRHED